MYISFSVKNTQKISRNNEIQALSFMLCQTFTNIFLKEMAIKDQRIHQNRKRNNQSRPTNNLIVNKYDGETLLHDKANAETSKVHIISDLDMKKTTNKFF